MSIPRISDEAIKSFKFDDYDKELSNKIVINIDEDNPIERHYEAITKCRNNMKVSMFAFSKAIKNAYDDLGADIFQNQLADKLGISDSYLSKWLQIANSKIIELNITKVPLVFSSLYEIALLENLYKKKNNLNYINELQTIFNKKLINPNSEQLDIQHLSNQLKRELVKSKKLSKSSRVGQLNNNSTGATIGPVLSLSDLVEKNAIFRTFILTPPSELLTRWGDDGFSDVDIGNEFPISELRGMTDLSAINCFICVKSNRINVALKILNASGFSYRDIFTSKQPANGFGELKDELVIVFGQRGKEKTPIIAPTKSLDLDSIVDLADQLSEGPTLVLFNKLNRKDCVCLTNPL